MATGKVLVYTLSALAFCACQPAAVAQTPGGVNDAARVAETVKQKAKASEKAEGRQDLIKDKVQVKRSREGEAVIEQTGEASSYGEGFHGKTTASGETFNQNDMSAAHPTLPMGTEAKVTNLETGQSVDLRINDRGPYAKGRDIDVSKKAAEELGMVKAGVAPVKIEAKVPATDAEQNSADPEQKK